MAYSLQKPMIESSLALYKCRITDTPFEKTVHKKNFHSKQDEDEEYFELSRGILKVYLLKFFETFGETNLILLYLLYLKQCKVSNF